MCETFFKYITSFENNTLLNYLVVWFINKFHLHVLLDSNQKLYSSVILLYRPVYKFPSTKVTFYFTIE